MNLVEDPRAAGEIRRYHTWAVHRDQSTAEHTWQILRILLTIWPTVPRNVIVHGLVHDSGEMSGDIQYPFKLLFEELEHGSVKAENYVRHLQQETLGAPAPNHPLSQFEKFVFKACDNLEMWEFGLRELNMGNRYAEIVRDRMATAVASNIANIEGLANDQQAQQNSDVVPAIKRYMNKRLNMENF